MTVVKYGYKNIASSIGELTLASKYYVMKQIVRANVALILALSIILPNSSILAMEMEVLTPESPATEIMVAEEVLVTVEEVQAEVIIDTDALINPTIDISGTPVEEATVLDAEQKTVEPQIEVVFDESVMLEEDKNPIAPDIDDSEPTGTSTTITPDPLPAPACVTDADELAKEGILIEMESLTMMMRVF